MFLFHNSWPAGRPAASGAAGQTDRGNLILRPFRWWSAEDCPHRPIRSIEGVFEMLEILEGEEGGGKDVFFRHLLSKLDFANFQPLKIQDIRQESSRGAVRID